MADVPYLTGGESATAGLMNSLYQEFDRRLAATLAGGKSPLLSQSTTFPANLLGKCFYFFPSGWPISNGKAMCIYAQRAGESAFMAAATFTDARTGSSIPGQPGYVPPNYNHSLFTGRVTAQVGSATYDETNKIAVLPQAGTSDYNTTIVDGVTATPYTVALPNEPLDGSSHSKGFGFWENSLQVHYVLHQGASDAAPVPYYVRDGDYAVPERPLNWAVAELICEGISSLAFDAAWDKYCFFRIHNLSAWDCTVTFPGGFAVTVPGFGCQTVRRDRVGTAAPFTFTNYRLGVHYFWEYEGGDPRSYWFLPRRVVSGGGGLQLLTQPGPRAVNGMQANNLWNASTLFDWVEALSMNDDALAAAQSVYGSASWGEIPQVTSGGSYDASQKVYARLIRDRTELWDASPIYKHAFGDPSNPATLVGDLIHHKGQFLIVRRSKTAVLPGTSTPVTTWEWASFNGYATIVTDFHNTAAGAVDHKLGVTTNGSGDLVITNLDGANNVILIPVTTNLFKNSANDYTQIGLYDWDGMQPNTSGLAGQRQTYVDLNAHGSSSPYTIESAILEVAGPTGYDFALNNSGPHLVLARTLNTAANTKNWNAPAYGPVTSTTVTGDPTYTVANSGTGTINTLHGIHAVTIADVLSLKYWRPTSMSGNDSVDGGTGITLSQYQNAKCTLTNEGLVLTFDEVVADIQPTTTSVSNDWWQWALGQLTRTRVVKFRGHGWGYSSPSVGARTTLFFAPRYPAWSTNFTYKNEVKAGADLSGWENDVPITNTPAQLLLRVRVPADQSSATDWKTRIWSSGLPAVNETAGYNGDTGAGYTAATAFTAATYGVAAPPLLPEHYNAMARMVNACSKGFGLTAAALYFRLSDGTITSFCPGYFSGSTYYQNEPFPVPIQAFATFTSESSIYQLCTEKGIAMHDFGTAPYDLSAYSDARNYGPAVGMRVALSGSASGTRDPGDPPDGPTPPVPSYEDVTYSVSATVDGPRAITSGTLITPSAYTGSNPSPLDALQFSADGICANTHLIYLKGDLIIGTDSGTINQSGTNVGSTSSTWHRRNLFPPGAAWCPFTTPNPSAILLFPTGAGNYDPTQPNRYPDTIAGYAYTWIPCTTSLGTWSSTSTLPSNSLSGVGSYWTTSASGSAGGVTWKKGNRLVWAGSTLSPKWWVAATVYDDLHWCTIDDVRTYLEGLGFLFMFNETAVPLELKLLNGFSTTALGGGATSDSASVQIDAGYTTNPPGSINTYSGNAADTSNYTLAYASEVITLPAAFPEQQYRFSCFTTNPTWKLRTSLGPSSLATLTPALVDIKSYTNGSEPVILADLQQFQLGLSLSGGTSGPVNGIILGLSGFQHIYYPTYAYASNPSPPPTYISNEPPTSSLSYNGLAWTHSTAATMEEWLATGLNASSFRQYCQLAYIQNNSTGITGAATITLTPAGAWGVDGTYWSTHTAWVLAGGPVPGTGSGRMPPVWYPAIGSASTVTPGNGTTLLQAPSGCAAYVQATSLVNVIDLGAL